MKFSVIIPVFNRPVELKEILGSLALQDDRDFETLVVDDGSTVDLTPVCGAFPEVRYYRKENGGPGAARNFGAEKAAGDYLIFFDSDCLVPPDYIATVRRHLERKPVGAWGGPDMASPDFTPMQKAVSYAMTSFFTTGGIRGGGEKLDRFFPRSFNMGVSREAFQKIGGFDAGMRFGEDIDLSIRLLEAGYATRLFKDAPVCHKRRTNLEAFFRQVFNSGIARINLSLAHPGTLKAVHVLPALFTLGCALLLLWSLLTLSLWPLSPMLLYALTVCLDAARREIRTSGWKDAAGVGLFAVAASLVQLTGYGSGFLLAVWRRLILGQGPFAAFTKNYR